MSNMGYCRFENTVADVLDCIDNWNRVKSESEEECRKELVRLAQQIVEDYAEDMEDEDE